MQSGTDDNGSRMEQEVTPVVEYSSWGNQTEKGLDANQFTLSALTRKRLTFQAILATLVVLVLTVGAGLGGGNWMAMMLLLGPFLPVYWITGYMSWVAATEIVLGRDSITFRMRRGTAEVPYTALRMKSFIFNRKGSFLLTDTRSGQRFLIIREMESFPEIRKLVSAKCIGKGAQSLGTGKH